MIYLPPVQSVFHTAGLSLSQLGILVTFPFIVWGSDEAYRAYRRLSPASG
ncbi:MAG TPA: hypothetical protein VHM66_01070 [Solirubrobacterales bacterium]|nr:hypothetical protein [Solirubrobacterales bacterium]